MAPTCASRRNVFRWIARKPHVEWPAYDSTPLYDRGSLAGLESDVRTVSEAWFDHDAHTSVELFVCTVPLAYFRFGPHDRYANSTRYEMATVFRLFVLKELHGWNHETALVEYLKRRSDIREQLSIESIPDQSTLWRSWHTRFTEDLRETIETVARTILITAQNAGITIPREPDRTLQHHDIESGQPEPDDGDVLDQASNITDHVSRIIFPAFSLNRGEGCEIHENAFWDLQTYLGLRKNLAANEGARSFIHESTRDQTPMGHAHRDHLRDLSIEQIREMYRQAVGRLLGGVERTLSTVVR